MFHEPYAFMSSQKRSDVTIDAARQFAELATLLRKWEGTSATATQQIAHFLIRLLLCLFAEDIGLLPNGLFSRLIAGTRTRPKAFTPSLASSLRRWPMAHAALDAAVCAAYGWPTDMRDEQMLERLLALNLEQAARGLAPISERA